MKTIKILYGSQSFGFDTKNSDKDHLEFIFPTWEDLIKPTFYTKEKTELDGSVTKIKDIRLLLPMIKKANISDLQVLYSAEIVGKEEFQWFIDHRDEIVKIDLQQCYKTNKGYCLALLKEEPYTGKKIARATSVLLFLKSLTTDSPKMFFPELKKLRFFIDEKATQKEKIFIVDYVKKELLDLEPFFLTQIFNKSLYEKCELEMVKLLKKHM